MELFTRRETVTQLKKEVAGADFVPLFLVCWFEDSDRQFELIHLEDEVAAQARLDVITKDGDGQPLGFIGYDPIESDPEEPALAQRLLYIYHDYGPDDWEGNRGVNSQAWERAYDYLNNIASAIEFGICLEKEKTLPQRPEEPAVQGPNTEASEAAA